jgi:hypothetical protein
MKKKQDTILNLTLITRLAPTITSLILLLLIPLLKPWLSMSSVHLADGRQYHLVTPIAVVAVGLLRLHHEHAAVTHSQPHVCRRCRSSPATCLHVRHRCRTSPVTRLHVAADDAPCRRLAHGRRTLHGNGLHTLAITSLPPVTQLTEQHTFLHRSRRSSTMMKTPTSTNKALIPTEDRSCKVQLLHYLDPRTAELAL